jgi:hypothetical protein
VVERQGYPAKQYDWSLQTELVDSGEGIFLRAGTPNIQF